MKITFSTILESKGGIKITISIKKTSSFYKEETQRVVYPGRFWAWRGLTGKPVSPHSQILKSQREKR